MSKNLRLLPLAGAVAAVVFSANVLATEATSTEMNLKPTDVLTDGWQVNGYIRAGWRVNENGVSTSNEYGKPDYRLAGTTGKNANQVEFNISKNTAFQNGVWSQLGVRAEFGNGDSSFYSSSGSEDKSGDGDFEVKEAFIRLGGFSFLPENAEIWAGRRYLNREQGLLSGEFWKQSSGVGFGYEQSGNGIAVVSVDVDRDGNGVEDGLKTSGKTIHSLDFYSYNHNMLGGSINLDLKLMMAGDKDNTGWNDKEATDGVGAAITYKRDYYGLDGWSATALAYGQGLAANRGVNFGHWSGGTDSQDVDSKDGSSIFFTSYGVMNINERWQMASEVTYVHGDKIWGLGTNANAEGDTVDRLLVAVRPTYKVNDNFRWEFTGSYGMEQSNWGLTENDIDVYAAEVAAVFTVNSDYFGRPQIKPFVTFISKDETNPDADWGTDGSPKDGNTYQFGVEAEIWF